MRRRFVLAVPLLLPLAARGETPLPIIASFTILADLVRQIGGSRVTVTSLVGPDADVHTYQPRPSDVRALQSAALVVENGLLLEPWLDHLLRSARPSGSVVIASTGIPTRTFIEGARAVTDPHIWQDPRNAIGMVKAIADALATADPAQAEAHRTRAAAFIAAITQTDAEIAQAIDRIPEPKRQVITSHDAFGYYGARYGIEFRAAQGIDTEAEPTPRDLARLAAQIKRDHIRAIFVENMTDPRIAAALAREAGAIVGPKVYSDSLSPPGGPAPTYLAMLRHNTAQFTQAMSAQ